MSPSSRQKIAFQGEPGANSDMAAQANYPDMEPLPCASFDDAFAAVKSGEAALGMIPIENTLAGRVADIHRLLPDKKLQIVGEYFMPIHFQLMVLPGVRREEIRLVRSHVHAIGQCRDYIKRNGWRSEIAGDTAGAARETRDSGDRTVAALAPELAAERYGLEILDRNVEDAENNVTRFVILRDPDKVDFYDPEERRMSLWAPRDPYSTEGVPSHISRGVVTTFLFEVKNMPAALYKALGGFATNGINMTKLESYQIGGTFAATQFYADIEGHPHDPSVKRALGELDFFSSRLLILGVYQAAGNRRELLTPAE